MATKKKPNKKSTKGTNRTLPIQEAPKENIKFTYFAACGNYPLPGFSHLANVWWTTNHFGQQLWKEIDRTDRQYADLGPAYKGTIPLPILLEMVSTEMFGGADFTKVYRNWTYKYQIGTARYVNGRYEERAIERVNKEGEKVTYHQKEYKADLETTVKKTVEKTKGNPPTTGFTKEERAAYRERHG